MYRSRGQRGRGGLRGRGQSTKSTAKPTNGPGPLTETIQKAVSAEEFAAFRKISLSFRKSEITVEEYHHGTKSIRQVASEAFWGLVDLLPDAQRKSELRELHDSMNRKDATPVRPAIVNPVGDVCPICFEEKQSDDHWTSLPCSHSMCCSCFESWSSAVTRAHGKRLRQVLDKSQRLAFALKNGQVVSCPVCRVPLVYDYDEVNKEYSYFELPPDSLNVSSTTTGTAPAIARPTSSTRSDWSQEEAPTAWTTFSSQLRDAIEPDDPRNVIDPRSIVAADDQPPPFRISSVTNVNRPSSNILDSLSTGITDADRYTTTSAECIDPAQEDVSTNRLRETLAPVSEYETTTSTQEQVGSGQAHAVLPPRASRRNRRAAR